MGRLILRSRAVLICVLIACAPAKETIREESTLLAETATVKASGKPPKLTLSSVQTTETGLRFTVQEDKQCIQAKEKKYRVKTIVERKADGVALGYGYGLSALGFGAGVPLLLHGSDTRGAGIAGIAVGAFFLALSVPTSLRAMDSVQNEREDVFETSAGVIVPCGATPAAGLRFNLVVHLAGNQLDPIRIVPLEPADQRGTVVVPLEALAPVFSAGKADPIAFVQSDLGTEVGSVGVGDLLKQWLVVQSEKDFARASSLDTAMAYREFLSRYPDSDRAPQARARYRQRRLNAIEPELRQAIRDQRLDSARNIIAEWKELDPSAISNRDELEQQYAVSMKAHRVGLLEEEIRRSIGRIDAGTTSEFAAALGAAESAVREIAELDGESQRVVRLRSQLSVLRNSAQGRLVTAITRSQPEHVGHLISELVEISGPDGRVAHQARSKYVAGLLAKARSSPTEAATLINWARLLCVGDDCEKARQAEEC